MAAEYQDLHVVVTGGTGALGSAVVASLLERGARCHVPCFSIKELERCSFAGDSRVRVEPGIDLRSEASVEAFYAGVPAGELWASIHVAGGFAMQSLKDTTRDAFMDMMELNALTVLLSTRQAVERMGPRGGRIVNVTARPALEPRTGAGMAAYAASKAAVATLTQALAAELKDRSVLVSAVAPSIMDTPANRKAMPGADHSAWPRLQDVAAAIRTLASPSNTLISGAIVPVYGRA
ncbi:MAG: SDR family NAD(P)-dependent oxidoreductase [Planctomycetota bacterium]|nr:SDR family NAD(P)-dependent oxidoreductase [Planctomycetota bacterium]